MTSYNVVRCLWRPPDKAFSLKDAVAFKIVWVFSHWNMSSQLQMSLYTDVFTNTPYSQELGYGKHKYAPTGQMKSKLS